ncbi:MAG: DNA mismatch repair protein MutS [Ignavibacteria bacterium]
MSTPLMNQYHKIKESHPDTILLFRVGDFFETFEEDAKTTSKVLGITLTRRSNGVSGETPLAGFPFHALDTYLPKLVRSGYRVAVCEQTENPKFAKGIVKREVVEVVTPGVALSDKLLDHKRNNYLFSVCIKDGLAGIAFCDISTGEFFAYETKEDDIKEQIELISPAEILAHKKDREFISSITQKINQTIRISRIDDWIFNFDYCRDSLISHFKTVNLKGFGIENLQLGIIAAGVILNYLQETQRVNLSHLNKLSRYNPSDYMVLDFSTKRNLEITYSMNDGGREGSLISILDKTETAMGGRMLKKWISAPLTRIEPILQRQECVEEFFNEKTLRNNLLNELRETGDLERLVSKVCTGKANPREIVTVRTSLNKIPLIKLHLESVNSPGLIKIREQLEVLDQLTVQIEKAIVDSPPLAVMDGGVINYGYSPELDELRDLSKNAKTWIADLQRTERERTGISSLKVSYNKVFGYYIEISNANRSKIPEDYIRKQTLVNGERYITPELKVYEDKILNAEEKIADLEFQLFNEVRLAVAGEAEKIQYNAGIIAMLDCYISLAECAFQYGYVKPVINLTGKIDIVESRHPVVERILKPGDKFAPNNYKLNNEDDQIIILTGPNMAGKSVYLRQLGLLVLLAQIGSFVPAKSAVIGIVDKIYTRVGASDNISAGESTFLVEMQEAANILNNASRHSLILLDEIGRGTSTFDGISIAWAITEYLHDSPDCAAKTLFATHYHELNEMATIFPRIKNYKVEVREYGDKVIFLHKVSAGGADHSYGIQVAQMAGLPLFVTNRAKEILENLEGKELTPHDARKARLNKLKARDEAQFSLFEVKDDSLRQEIRDIKIDAITPLEALNKLSDLMQKINNS